MALGLWSGSGILNRGILRWKCWDCLRVTFSHPCGTDRLSNLYPGLRPGPGVSTFSEPGVRGGGPQAPYFVAGYRLDPNTAKCLPPANSQLQKCRNSRARLQPCLRDLLWNRWVVTHTHRPGVGPACVIPGLVPRLWGDQSNALAQGDSSLLARISVVSYPFCVIRCRLAASI